MKIIKRLSLAILFFGSMVSVHGQADDKKNVSEARFKVAGVCNMCKDRIENAALIKGVKFAEWTADSLVLHVVFSPKKVTIDEIHHAVAEMGHDTDRVKASGEAYEKLPDCCAYRDGVEVH